MLSSYIYFLSYIYIKNSATLFFNKGTLSSSFNKAEENMYKENQFMLFGVVLQKFSLDSQYRK